jgi:hypothetical protein
MFCAASGILSTLLMTHNNKDGGWQTGNGYNFGLGQDIDAIPEDFPIFSMSPDQMPRRPTNFDAIRRQNTKTAVGNQK